MIIGDGVSTDHPLWLPCLFTCNPLVMLEL